MLNECFLFVNGIKPALLVERDEKEYHELKKQFPYIDFGYGNRLYLQNEKQKEAFLQKGVYRANQQLFYKEDELGYVLGYPKIAVANFLKGIESTNRINVDYHGINFVVHRDCVYEALIEIQNNMPIPLELIQIYKSDVFFFELTENGFQEMTYSFTTEWRKALTVS